MSDVFDWSAPLLAAYGRLLQQFVEYLPQLAGGVLLLLIGWVVARVLRAITARLVGGWDRLMQWFGLDRSAEQPAAGQQPIIAIAGGVVYWLTILFFVTAAAHTLDLEMFSAWLDEIILHLPNLISGVLIIVIGIALSNLARDAAVASLKSTGARQRDLLGRGAQVATLAVMVVIGAAQIGIDITLLVTLFAVVVGAGIGGAALAFGLGAQAMVGNLLGARHAHRSCRLGDVIRIGAIEGRVVELTKTGVVLDTGDGKATVPARLFLEQASIVLDGAQGRA